MLRLGRWNFEFFEGNFKNFEVSESFKVQNYGKQKKVHFGLSSDIYPAMIH